MKLYIEKVKVWLLKNYSLGIILLVISGFFGYFWIPIVFYPQKTGVVESIEETTEQFKRYRGLRRHFKLNILIFTIDGEKYRTTKMEGDDTERLLDLLLGNEVCFRFSTMRSENFTTQKRIREIIYDGKIIITNDKAKRVILNRFVIDKFVFWFVLFILNLSWCVWVFVLKWRSVP